MLDHLSPQLLKLIPPIPKEGFTYSRIIKKNDGTRQTPAMGAPITLCSETTIIDPFETNPAKRKKKLVYAPTEIFVENPLTGKAELIGKPESLESTNNGNFPVREDEFLKHAYLFLNPDRRKDEKEALHTISPNTRPPMFELVRTKRQVQAEEMREMENQRLAYDVVRKMGNKELRTLMTQYFSDTGSSDYFDLLGKDTQEIKNAAYKRAKANPLLFLTANLNDETRAKMFLSEAQLEGTLIFDRSSRRWVDTSDKEICGVAIGKDAEEAILTHLAKLGEEGMEKLKASWTVTTP